MRPDEDLWGEPVPIPPATSPFHGWPAWFTVGKRTPACHRRRVAAGLHPLGALLGATPGALCGNCAWMTRRYSPGGRSFLKCLRTSVTSGPATDLRAKWAGCSEWSVALPGARVARARPPARVGASDGSP